MRVDRSTPEAEREREDTQRHRDRTLGKFFFFSALLPEGCTNYTVLDDVTRDVNYNSTQDHKDDGLQPGWYRFLLNGTNAVMPTTCVYVSRYY